ncbi:flagellar basal-body MS-ring/collar protein FliF [Actibacterium lipolyticum]|uniref:Flagellar M-ring protein n=1 Tax=Actibacterium lipolyticum TaxID=1524263 RepID=A0A238KXF1_9RHOB|nr:flagellar basal-body MS-ring/collar protein FliF [Actibacterium lipolyticum]SMX47368.1 Flagellar M-ring protein [Actibacterium lipolyticum]
MQQLTAVWSSLDMRKRAVVALSTIAMFAAILAMSRMAAAPNMALLYSGLEGGAAGEVVQALEQRAVPYEVRGGSIFVDSSQRDELRMTLASDGLPANGSSGYELLDSLSGFGTTSQMFDAAYWRAKEGELARTILASPHIRAARVHIANASGQPFRRDLKVSASVTVTPAGAGFSSAQAKALRYLVASSVAGLAPEDVSVINGTDGVILVGDTGASQTGEANNREAELRQNVERLLAARMGPGRAVVEVSVETVTDRESIVERRFDPDTRVAISTDTEERSTSANDQGSGAVTIASNLPDGDAGTNRNSSSTDSETRERVNYEVSETQREVFKSPGAIKRLSVAVLLDGVRTVGPDGKEVWQALPAEDLASLEELVASAVGFDEARGDVITLKSMEFQPVPALGTAAQPGLIQRMDMNPMEILQLGVLAIVGIILGLFVVRPILLSKPVPISASLPPPATPGLDGEIETGQPSVETMNLVSDTAQNALPVAVTDPVDRLRQMIDDRSDETVEVLRTWLEEDEERV